MCFLPQEIPGFRLDYPSLTLHALTPASADAPAHIYCQIDDGSGDEEVGGDAQENGHEEVVNGLGGANGHVDESAQVEEEEDFSPMRELRIYIDESKRDSIHPFLPALTILTFTAVQALFSALSQCSALHASLLPNGEPSSFFGFGDMGDGPEDEVDEEDDDDPEGDEDGSGGRVRSDFHSGGGPEARYRPY